jgi:DNA polymerase III subunit epsilon
MTDTIRFCALLDTETTGLDPFKDRAIEVAVTLFDVVRAQPVASFASLIRNEAKNEAQEANGIIPEMLPEAREAERVWAAVRWVIEPAQIIIAHNAEFDRKFVPEELQQRTWVCSENDIAWPGSKKGGRGGSLAHLALSLGLGVAHAHRAMSDVDTLSRIFTRLAEKGHDLQAMLKHAMRPKAMFHSLASYEERETVKQHGFRWDPERKIWWRRMPIDDAAKLPFKTVSVS